MMGAQAIRVKLIRIRLRRCPSAVAAPLSRGASRHGEGVGQATIWRESSVDPLTTYGMIL